jgi:hypothetical protein
MPRRPLSRTALHTIGVRRRGDPDVLDLLHEIRRLHEALADLYDLIEPLPKVQFGVQQLADWKRLAAAMLASHAIVRLQKEQPRTRFDPSLPDSQPVRRRKPERGPVAGYAQRRVQQVAEEEPSERDAKRRARLERG